MSKNYLDLFSILPPVEPAADLFDKINQRLQQHQRLIARKYRLLLLSVTLGTSLIALIPTFRLVMTGFTESGFSQFLSLIFSDAGVLAAYWENLAFSLLESLPIASILTLLTVVFIFFISLKLLIKNLQIIFIPLNKLTRF
ncbi:MAG: hypothetical protein NTV81_04005 [Candidatus Komeilibacteria bacterium]|nr:hypothetical protein [Candidatus Komeilibacteria bacterium]